MWNSHGSVGRDLDLLLEGELLPLVGIEGLGLGCRGCA